MPNMGWLCLQVTTAVMMTLIRSITRHDAGRDVLATRNTLRSAVTWIQSAYVPMRNALRRPAVRPVLRSRHKVPVSGWIGWTDVEPGCARGPHHPPGTGYGDFIRLRFSRATHYRLQL
jgi:hypothetical protein